jgi:hypothetical protein
MSKTPTPTPTAFESFCKDTLEMSDPWIRVSKYAIIVTAALVTVITIALTFGGMLEGI